MSLLLSSCATEPRRAYDYCVAEEVQRLVVSDKPVWTAHCRDGDSVSFFELVQDGDKIYFSSFWENDDAITRYGYIHSLQR